MLSPGPDAVVDSPPPYAEGMAHFQTGEWAEAIRCFEEAGAPIPGVSCRRPRSWTRPASRPGWTRSSSVKGRRWIIPWRPLLLRAAIVLAIGVLALVGFQLVTCQVAPAIAQAQEQQPAGGAVWNKAAAISRLTSSMKRRLHSRPCWRAVSRGSQAQARRSGAGLGSAPAPGGLQTMPLLQCR